ncbi:serine--tRNA ligase [Ruminococcaceae bacterium OttesenSCG-928-I18]|nr:serine--tRNA ligase [Ruminococcaceae bacterium OttesenSCG-928-I18]
MLDIKLLRAEPARVKAGFRKREMVLDDAVDNILRLDEERRGLVTELDSLKAKQNAVSKKIPQMKKAGEDTAEVMAEMKELSEEVKEGNARLSEIEAQLREGMLSLPNLPDEEVPSGGKEQNVPLRTFGEKPTFDFTPKNHMELCESLGLVDYERGAKLGGNGSWVYRGKGARLEWALLNFFISEHLADGYEFLLPPHMLVWECGTVAGQFPKFSEDVFQIANPTSEDKKFMLPTAETALVNLHRGEILAEEELPKKYIAYTPCYRREAGSYRSEERGMIRGHQFNKVEMVQYATEQGSDAAFEELLQKAENLVQKLGLHHRVSQLAAGDVSASMAKTVDIEVWLPSMGIYKEVSSASNAREYQARRGNIKYRDGDKKLHFAHTLNASGLATSRVFPALLEQCQQEDGSVLVPKVLRPFTGFDRIEADNQSVI